MKYASKRLKVCYILAVLAMMIHIVILAGQCAELGFLSLTTIIFYFPVFALLEIFRLGNRFYRTESIALKVSSIVLMVVHILCFVGFIAVNAHQLHTAFSMNCLPLFLSLFTTAAFYPLPIITAYCLDALVGIFAKK